MIPEIGILIAIYAFVRFFDMAATKTPNRPDWAYAFLIFFSIAGMVAAVFVAIDLFFAGHKAASGLPPL